jgi:HEAT repeat protein
MTEEKVLEAWRRGGASRDRVLVELAREDVQDWAERLVPGETEARRLAASLLARSPHPVEALGVLRRLATDEDRYTREAAAHAAGGLLTEHFDEAYPILGTWRTDPAPLLRRAVVLAAGAAADAMRLDRARPLLRLLDPLLVDRTSEVRTALSGVLSEVLFGAYPDDVFEELTYWSASHDAQVLWHVAVALGRAPAAMGRRALIVLRRVALDERRYVRGAVARSLVHLAATCPDAVGVDLRRWLTDEDRAGVAREALGRIGTEIAASGLVPVRPSG